MEDESRQTCRDVCKFSGRDSSSLLRWEAWKTHTLSARDPRAASSRKPASHLSDGVPHLGFSCVSLASTSHVHIRFSNSSTPEGSLLCPLQVSLPGTRATPSRSQMVLCLQDTQSSAEQTGLNPQALFQRDIAKIFMRSSVWRQEENVGNRSSLLQRLPVVWS